MGLDPLALSRPGNLAPLGWMYCTMYLRRVVWVHVDETDAPAVQLPNAAAATPAATAAEGKKEG